MYIFCYINIVESYPETCNTLVTQSDARASAQIMHNLPQHFPIVLRAEPPVETLQQNCCRLTIDRVRSEEARDGCPRAAELRKNFEGCARKKIYSRNAADLPQIILKMKIVKGNSYNGRKSYNSSKKRQNQSI